MGKENSYGQFRDKVELALTSKIDEFTYLGYDTITEDDLWFYLVQKKWQTQAKEFKLYQVVSDILTVKIGEYMNFKTVEAFRTAEETQLEISAEEMQALFGD